MAVRKKLKYKHFVRARYLEYFVEENRLQKDDIVYVGKSPEGTWEMLCYLQDDGNKQNI